MRFSSCVPVLAIAGGLVSAAQHSGRSLQHVGKKDLPHKSFKRELPPQIQQRSESSQYLTNKTASRF
jgi:carboxypeptidase D